MNDESGWFKIGVGVLCLAAFVWLFIMLSKGLDSPDPAVKLPLLVITGIMALFTTLALVAVTFSVAGLSDKSQALGLPEGSVRAAIALSLIVIFALTSIFLFNSMATARPAGTDAAAIASANEFAKQIFAVVGTLMTSVVSFYFAARAVTSAVTAPLSTPTLASVSPTQAIKGTEPVVVPISISGTGLQLAKTVSFEMAGATVLATDVSSSDQLVKCEITIVPGLAPGKYSVVVTNTDDATATLPAAFEVQIQAAGGDGGAAAGGGPGNGIAGGQANG